MLLIHGKVLGEDFRFDTLDLEIQDGKILRVGKGLPYAPEDTVIDCEGYTIVPVGELLLSGDTYIDHTGRQHAAG